MCGEERERKKEIQYEHLTVDNIENALYVLYMSLKLDMTHAERERWYSQPKQIISVLGIRIHIIYWDDPALTKSNVFGFVFVSFLQTMLNLIKCIQSTFPKIITKSYKSCEYLFFSFFVEIIVNILENESAAFDCLKLIYFICYVIQHSVIQLMQTMACKNDLELETNQTTENRIGSVHFMLIRFSLWTSFFFLLKL